MTQQHPTIKSPVSFSWEGSDNPNDPSGIATFRCDGIKMSVALDDFTQGSKLATLFDLTYKKGWKDAIDRAQRAVLNSFAEDLRFL
jgi:hypothetical protein